MDPERFRPADEAGPWRVQRLAVGDDPGEPAMGGRVVEIRVRLADDEIVLLKAEAERRNRQAREDGRPQERRATWRQVLKGCVSEGLEVLRERAAESVQEG